MEIDPSEPSDQNSPADHELGPKQPNRGRNPSGWFFTDPTKFSEL